MQNTLLALAIAIILAVVTALVAPLMVDWGGYRSLFEKEASRLTGVELRVTGPIDVRLLPSPRLLLRDIEAGGDDKFRAKALSIEFALGPLMRGEWRASELIVSGPQFRAGLDAAGKIQAPNLALAIDPDTLSVDRLAIENGTAVLVDAENGAELVLNNLWFNGDLRSLAGPLKGEGAATVGGSVFPYRISLGRVSAERTLRLHLNIDPTNYPLSVEADGILSFKAEQPQFEGTLNLAKPVGIALRGTDGLVTQPWRVGGKIKITSASALMELIEFQYGSEPQGITLSGTAEFKFGRDPRFDGVLSGRQVDLDQVAGGAEGSRPPPAATLRRLAGLAGSAFRPSIPIQLGIGIDQVTLGGATIQTVRGDISTEPAGWRLDRFEFRAPGFTQVRLNGSLAVDAAGVTFTGPADIATGDANKLAAWLEGRSEPPAGAARSLRMRGDITLGSEKIAIERLNAAFDREAMTGRFAYLFAVAGKGARLDAALSAPQLDIDAAWAFANAVLAGSVVERPSEVALALDIGRATVAGFEARNISARTRLDGGQLDIAKLAVEDFGGASVSASGQIALTPVPRGDLKLDFDARDLTAVATLLGKSAPSLGDALQRAAPDMAPAKLRATLNLDGATPVNHVTLGIEGAGGAVRISARGQAAAEPASLNAATVRLQSKLEAADGGILVRMLGLDRLVAVGKDPGVLMLTVSGPALGDLQVIGHIKAGGLAVSSTGTLRPSDPAGISGAMYANVERADVAPLLGRDGKAGPSLPLAFTTRLSLGGGEAKLDEISAAVAGTRLRGSMSVGLQRPYRLSGELNADNLDLAALLAAGVGMPGGVAANGDTAWKWPDAPFGGGPGGTLDGGIILKAVRAAVWPGLALRDLRTFVRFGGGVVLDELSGQLAGGKVSGRLSLQPDGSGIALKSTLKIDGADAEALLPGAARAPVTGKVNLDAQIEGTGRSPAALAGALHGSGKVSLSQGQFSSLDPRAFDAAIRAVDNGLPADAGKLATLTGTALESGQLAVKRADAEFTVEAGQIRLGDATVKGEGADASVSGRIDLTDGTMDVRLVLSGPAGTVGARPSVFLSLRGPVSAPARRIDVSALSGWLTLRAIERQSKRIEQIEGTPRPANPARRNPPAAEPLPLSPQN